jgi:hypothetical protein
MKFFANRSSTNRALCAALATLILLWGMNAQALDTDSDMHKNTARISANIGPYSYGVYSITEGMRDFPIQKQLTNTMPLSMDFSIIFVIGWTGDKLYIKLTDDGGDGDRLQGIGIAQYDGRELVPYWSTVYSTTAHDSCEIIIPVYAPGIAVYLLSGYWGLSIGENPYAYTIYLSFPQ